MPPRPERGAAASVETPRDGWVELRVARTSNRPDTSPMSEAVESCVLEHLRASHEPVREFSLYDRVAADLGAQVTPDRFIDALERLMTTGRVHVIADTDAVRPDPAPFQPRYYRLVE